MTVVICHPPWPPPAEGKCHAVTLELGQDEGGPNICAPDRSEPDIPMSDKGTAFVHLRDQVGSGRSFWFA